MATPISTANQSAGRDVDESRRPRRARSRRPEAAAEQRGDGEGAEAERQHPRMEVRLERVGAGAWNPVPQRERRRERDRQPGRRDRVARPIATRPSRSAAATAGTRPGTGTSSGSPVTRTMRGDDLVAQHQPALRVDQRRIARERVRLAAPATTTGNVERLIGDAVPVAGAVGGGEQHEETRRQPQLHDSCGASRASTRALVRESPRPRSARRSTGAARRACAGRRSAARDGE